MTHQLQYLSKVDFIYVLEDGKVVESGTHNELLERRGEYSSMISKHVKMDNLKEEIVVDQGADEDLKIEKKKVQQEEQTGDLMTAEDREVGR